MAERAFLGSVESAQVLRLILGRVPVGGRPARKPRHGEKGCAAAAAEKPDLILLDLDLPVIALPAHAIDRAREKALTPGCDEFDTNPVEFERLLGKTKMKQLLGP